MGTPSNKFTKFFLLAHKNLRKKIHKIALLGGIFLSCSLILSSLFSFYLGSKEGKQVLGVNISRIQQATAQALSTPILELTITPSQTPTSTPNTPTPTPVPTEVPTSTPKPPQPTIIPTIIQKVYTAEKIDDTTWRVDNVQTDTHMASPQEIVNALNSYRASHGRGSLTVDEFLSSYAKGRADKFASSGLDGHADFRSFMDNDGFSQAGFNALGENSAVVSGPMSGEKLVNQIFGADPAHDSNQLDSWTHVGVGVNGNAINVNFGRGKR